MLGLSSVDFVKVSAESVLCGFYEGECWVCPLWILRRLVFGLSSVDFVKVSTRSVLCGFCEG